MNSHTVIFEVPAPGLNLLLKFHISDPPAGRCGLSNSKPPTRDLKPPRAQDVLSRSRAKTFSFCVSLSLFFSLQNSLSVSRPVEVQGFALLRVHTHALTLSCARSFSHSFSLFLASVSLAHRCVSSCSHTNSPSQPRSRSCSAVAVTLALALVVGDKAPLMPRAHMAVVTSGNTHEAVSRHIRIIRDRHSKRQVHAVLHSNGQNHSKRGRGVARLGSLRDWCLIHKTKQQPLRLRYLTCERQVAASLDSPVPTGQCVQNNFMSQARQRSIKTQRAPREYRSTAFGVHPEHSCSMKQDKKRFRWGPILPSFSNTLFAEYLLHAILP